MSLILIALLAFTQGFTEFLPVSSQGHLVFVNNFFDYQNTQLNTLEINIIAHFGSLIAVVFMYRQTLFNFFRSLKMIARPDIDSNVFFINNILISTLPIIFIGFFFAKYFNYESDLLLTIIASSSIFFGGLIFFVDKFCLRIKNLDSLNYKLALLIGFFQCFALCPGVSRSGALITIMRFLGFRREFSVQYTNLLSIPVITGAVVYLISNNLNEMNMNKILSLEALILATLSFIFSLIFIYFFINWVKKFSFSIFAFYRIIFGLLIIFYFL